MILFSHLITNIHVSLQAIIIFMAVQWTPVTLFSDEYIYPDWCMAIGWVILCICLVPMPIYFIFKCIKTGGPKVSFTPTY